MTSTRAERRPHEHRALRTRQSREPPCSQARLSARHLARYRRRRRLHRPSATAAPVRHLSLRCRVSRSFVFIIGFSLLLPRTFFTLGNFRTIVSSQAVLMILALGLTLPLTTGEFDLSIGLDAWLRGRADRVFHWRASLAAAARDRRRPFSSASSPAR